MYLMYSVYSMDSMSSMYSMYSNSHFVRSVYAHGCEFFNVFEIRCCALRIRSRIQVLHASSKEPRALCNVINRARASATASSCMPMSFARAKARSITAMLPFCWATRNTVFASCNFSNLFWTVGITPSCERTLFQRLDRAGFTQRLCGQRRAFTFVLSGPETRQDILQGIWQPMGLSALLLVKPARPESRRLVRVLEFVSRECHWRTAVHQPR